MLTRYLTMRTLLALTIVLLPSAAVAEQFTLACHLVSDPQPKQVQYAFDTNYVVDTDKGTVNNLPAIIEDDAISFRQTGQDGTQFTTKIKRHAATATVGTEFGPLLSGACKRGPLPN